MNGIERIKEKILADAKAESEKILEEARNEAEGIIRQAEKEANRKAQMQAEKATEDALSLKKRLHAVSGLEDRKKILKARQDSIEEVFTTGLQKLCNLPDDQYGQFLQKLVLTVAREGNGVLFFNERDKARLGEGFVTSINNRFKDMNLSSQIGLGTESINASGGFVLRYGDMEINCTLDILVAMKRPELETEVAEILFKE